MALTLQQADYDFDYYNGGGDIGGYSFYSATTYSSETADQLAQKFIDKSGLSGISLLGKKVLVIGCAYGFLVQYLITRGVDVYGMDWSSYALSQAPVEVSAKLSLGDARQASAWTAVRTLAGLTKANQKFDLIIDEDMICCMSDADAVTMRTLALDNCNIFMHLIDVDPNLITWYNYHDIAGWKAILGTSPKEKWYSRFNWLEV